MLSHFNMSSLNNYEVFKVKKVFNLIEKIKLMTFHFIINKDKLYQINKNKL